MLSASVYGETKQGGYMTGKREWSEKRTLAAGVIGNVLEWYDFGVYGFFASIIATQFFPSSDPMVSLIAAFGAFAAGFLMRPVGGMIFGHLGDKYGRGLALQLSVLCMAVPTFLIGLLPTYKKIGAAAAVLMVVMRMIQGAAVGGEYTSSIVFLAERAPIGKRAFYSCWSFFGAVGGMLMGSAVGALLSNTISPEALTSWGWRLAFMAGILVSGTGYLIRKGMVEKPAEKHEKMPLAEAFRFHKLDMIRVTGFNVVNAVTFYLMFVYAVTWMIKNVHVSRSEALDINTITMLTLLILTPLCAKLSDVWGRKKTLLLSMGGIVLLAYPLIRLMHHPDFAWMLMGQLGFAVLAGLFGASIPAAMVEMFPKRIRVTAVSVSYNITFAILGGTSPMVAVWLIERSHSDLAFAWYIAGAALVSFLVTLTLKDRRNEALD